MRWVWANNTGRARELAPPVPDGVPAGLEHSQANSLYHICSPLHTGKRDISHTSTHNAGAHTSKHA